MSELTERLNKIYTHDGICQEAAERITKLESLVAKLDAAILSAQSIHYRNGQHIAEYQLQIKALEIDRDTWMGKYTTLRNAVDG